jgi:hypothetical protein
MELTDGRRLAERMVFAPDVSHTWSRRAAAFVLLKSWAGAAFIAGYNHDQFRSIRRGGEVGYLNK